MVHTIHALHIQYTYIHIPPPKKFRFFDPKRIASIILIYLLDVSSSHEIETCQHGLDC